MIHPSKFQKILLCCCVEIYQIWVYHWGVRAFSAKSAEHLLLNILLWNQNLFNQLEILWKTCWYVYVVSTIFLIENDDDLGKLSSIQKCIKWGWCTIQGWMTVFILDKVTCLRALLDPPPPQDGVSEFTGRYPLIGRQVGDQYKEQRELTKMTRVAFGFQRMIGKQELYVGCTPPFAG